MNLEQLALLGIGIFVFMALANLFGFARTIKRAGRGRGAGRPRRLIGGLESARACATSVITEVMNAHPEEVEASRLAGQVTPELDAPLQVARTYYLGRVESMHKILFNQVVDDLVLKK